MLFHVFGSASSVDCDVVVFVSTLPTLEEGKALAARLAPELAAQLGTEKKLNINFAVLHEGVIVATLKGLPDETNNAVLATYGLHKQAHPLAVAHPVMRDRLAKFDRTARIVLSHFTRTEQREAIKQALRGDLQEKCAMLLQVDLATPLDFGKNGPPEDAYKSIAFQLGQAVALADGEELYTKEEIRRVFPFLEPSLYRKPLTPANLWGLEALKGDFMAHCDPERGRPVSLTRDPSDL
jgi:hypothetical protein